mgnify:CR=1 FL=1
MGRERSRNDQGGGLQSRPPHQRIRHCVHHPADIAHHLTESSRNLQHLSGELDKLVGNFRL